MTKKIENTSLASAPRVYKFAQILEAARDELILHNGIDRILMEDVAARAKVSKATIYSYFANKEEMFEAVIFEEIEQLRISIEQISYDATQDFVSKLTEAGVRILTVWLSPRTLPLLRILIANVDRFEELAGATHHVSKSKLVNAISKVLRNGAAHGDIVCDDSAAAALIFIRLVAPDLILTALLEPNARLDPSRFEAQARWAANVLAQIYRR
jgi:AcrR family transcriptional regulator